MASHRRLSLFLAFVCLVPSAVAQQYTIKKIVFAGDTPYSQTALEAASGLKPGDTITNKDLRAASQRLVDTGAFADLSSTLDGTVKAISVVFKVKAADPTRMLTATFDNFVWLDPRELAVQLQRAVPLFNGTVPEAGNQSVAIVAALTQMLAAKGVNASVTFEPVAPSPSEPLRLAEFRVEEPRIVIHTVTLSGVTPPFSDATDKLIHSLTGRNYNEGAIVDSIQNRLLAVYRNAGYQASSIASLSRTIASSSSGTVNVDIAATLVPGDLYRLSHLDWAGSAIMTSAGFAADSDLHPGDIASQKALRTSLGKLETAYRNEGYMDVVVTASPHLDVASHEVAFTVAATAGEQYKLRKVTSVGLSDAQQKDFDKAWKMGPGDVFNEGYASGFLTNNSALQSFAGYYARFKTIADPDAHTVELVMTFIRAGK